MEAIQQLESICQTLEGWRGPLRKKVDIFNEEAPVPAVRVLITEAKEIIRTELGDRSSYGENIQTSWVGHGGRPRNPEDSELHEIVLLIRAAVRAISVSAVSRTTASPASASFDYVDEGLISQVKALRTPRLDFSRLAELCRELNVVALGEAHMATAMILRSIIDHVPPAFGNFKDFSEVANNYGSRSFKSHMKKFEVQLRNIADGHLHTHIRSRESLPSFIEVDFRSSLGELVREIVRIHGE